MLSEGVDGCVFTAPHNWPCASPANLPAYNPEDPTLVTKIVKQADTEDVLLRHLNTVRTTYRLTNLPEFIGACEPKAAALPTNTPNTKAGFTEHLRNLQTKRKGCAGWLTNLQLGPSFYKRKMYVERKYLGTLSAYTQMLREKVLGGSIDPGRVAATFAAAVAPFLHTLSVLATRPPYRVIHYDLHVKNIALYPDPVRTYDPLDASTFTVGPADFGRALWRDVRVPLTEAAAIHWDEPFVRQFVLRKSPAVYWNFSQYSLENRLLSFVAQKPTARPTGKTWLETWASDPKVVKATEGTRDPLLLSLPTLLSVLPTSRKWRTFEASLEQLVQQLQSTEDSPAARFALLQRNPSLRAFLDAIKGRSMLPVAFGIFLRNALLAMGLERADLATAFAERNELSFKKIHPATGTLVPVFHQYWNLLLGPYSVASAASARTLL